MDSSKPSVASGVPSSARQAWHSGMGASPNIANRTQVPAQDLRAAGVDSSRQRSGVQDPGLYFAGPTQFAQVPQGYSQPAQWERVVGGYPMPPIVQSAYVPPVAGVYPPRQARYGTVPLPSQSSNPEPLFEAVNPFEARRWRQPARPTAPTEPQPPHADDYWAQVSPGPPVIPEHPIQRQPVQSATNPVWMPSPFIPVQPTQYQAYQPTQFQPYQQLQSTDPADNPAWLAPNTAGGGPLLNPAFPGQATVYPQTANYPAYAPAIPGSLPFQSFPQASRARVPFQRNDFESEDGSNEGIGRSKPVGACTRCKRLKIKCEFETGTVPCKRCFNGGHDCIIAPRKQHSAPPKHQEVGNQIPEQTIEPQQLEEEPSQPPPIPHHASLTSIHHSTAIPVLAPSETDQPSPPSPFLDDVHATRPPQASLSEPASSLSYMATPSIAETIASMASSSRSHIPQRSRSSSPSAHMSAPEPTTAPLYSRTGYSIHSPISARPVIPSSISVNSLPSPAVSRSRKPSPLETATLTVVLILFDFIPRQLYLHFLLRIPSLYFSRVTRIFEDARLSLPDIKRMARARPDQWTNPSNMNPWQPNVPSPDRMRLPQSLLQFRSNWEAFIESLMREWNTFNIISVLLLSAILTMLQIESASHPITRVSALLSLICALMSLLYGCMYIIRFGTMRKMHKASSFAGEAQKGTTSILWNIWVLLAMPAVWLAWSIISFLTCVMSFIWLSGTSQDQNDFAMSPRAALGCRLGLTLVFALGVIYFALIIKTFYQYGDPLDREWTRTVNGWMKETATYPPLPRNMYNAREAPVMPGMPFLRPESQRNPSHTSFRRGPPMFSSLKPGEGYFDRLPRFTPLSLKPSAFFKTPHPASFRPAEPLDIMHLRHPDVYARLGAYDNPDWADAVTPGDFIRFELDVSNAWHGRLALRQPEDGASTDIPMYTLLSPSRPENPEPISESDAGLDMQPSARGTRPITSSETSYGPVLEPTRHMAAPFSASETPAVRGIPIPDGVGDKKIFSKTLSTSVAQSPPDDIEPDTSRAPQPAERSKVDAAPDPVEAVRELIDLWNERYFHPRHLEASLVPRQDSSDPAFDVNLAWWLPAHLSSEEPFDEKALNLPNDVTQTPSEPSVAGSFATAGDTRPSHIADENTITSTIY